MKELEIIKAFAELDGVDVELVDFDGVVCYVRGLDEIYNPIEDCALTFKAMVDYDVQKSQSMINPEKTMISIRGSEYVVSVFIRKEIPHAIIECILKSKGLWQ